MSIKKTLLTIIKEKGAGDKIAPAPFSGNGSPSRARTYDNTVNSRALYHRYEYIPKDEDIYIFVALLSVSTNNGCQAPSVILMLKKTA